MVGELQNDPWEDWWAEEEYNWSQDSWGESESSSETLKKPMGKGHGKPSGMLLSYHLHNLIPRSRSLHVQ